MAKSLLIFFWTHLICAVSDMPYHTYVVVKWNPANQENYDPYVLYWTGISVSIYYNLTSLSVLLLSLDRLLILRFFHHHKNKNLKKWFLRVTVIFLLGYSIYPTVDYLMLLPLEKDKFINLLISAYFLWTFRKVSTKERVIAFNALPSVMVTVLLKIYILKFSLNFNGFITESTPTVLFRTTNAKCDPSTDRKEGEDATKVGKQRRSAGKETAQNAGTASRFGSSTGGKTAIQD
ncbi:hypothetical protein DdX_19410 [Ditylenchus destructor]|uniref:Uncharacterized protein n=1 Tax=Ditylenchus destructor TaxID=166010 RepID=A0AAD4QX55_9BILA|nr:hypothetical protein DdX_19410 [Ditylenchus destructor]